MHHAHGKARLLTAALIAAPLIAPVLHSVPAVAAPPTPAGWNIIATRVDTQVGVGASLASGQIAARREGALAWTTPSHPWNGLPPLPAGQVTRQLVTASGGTYARGDQGIYQAWGTGWRWLSGPVRRIVGWADSRPVPGAGDRSWYSVLYAEDRAGRTLLRYDGLPHRWTAVGETGAMYAETDPANGPNRLYRLSADRSSVWEYALESNRWTRIGGPVASIAASPQQLFAIGHDGVIRLYRDGGWLQLAAAAGDRFRSEPGGKLVLGSTGSMYYLSAARDAVWAYRQEPWDPRRAQIIRTWRPVITGMRLTDIYTAGRTVGNTGSDLLALRPDGTLSLFTWPEPTVHSRVMPRATVGRPYSAALAAMGGTGPYLWFMYTDHLPSGLRLDLNGQITGTPTGPGTWAFTVALVDAAGAVRTAPIWITVDPAPAPPAPPPPPAPPAPGGFSGIGWYNCLTSAGPLHVWVNDVTAATGWREAAGSPIWPSGCPFPSGPPLFTAFEDGHVYEVVAVDVATCGVNTPALLACRRQYIAARGSRAGAALPTQYVP